MGRCPGPELGENTSHLEKNIIVLPSTSYCFPPPLIAPLHLLLLPSRHISFIDSNKGSFLLRGWVSLVAVKYIRIHTLTHIHSRYYTHNTYGGFPRSMGSNARRGSEV